MGVTWDPAKKAANIALAGGNRTASKNTDAALNTVLSTLGKSSGKWYFEVLYDQGYEPSPFTLVGVAPVTANLNTFVGNEATSYGYYAETGAKVNNNITTAYGGSWVVGNIIGVAVDMTTGSIWFAKNNVWQGSGDPAAGTGAAFTGLTGTMYAGASLYNGTFMPYDQMIGRFATADLFYSPPAGFAAWDDMASAAVAQTLDNFTQTAVAERVYWNPVDQLDFTFSNSNKTATRVGSTAWRAARASKGRSSGKYYFEQTIDALGTTGDDSLIHGLGVSTTPLNDYIGSSTSGTTAWGLQVAATPNARTTFNNGFQYTSTPSQTVGGYSRWAVDLTAGNIWIGTPAGWLNGGDPAVGTSPTFTFSPVYELFPMLSCVSANAAVTLLTRANEFIAGAPAGFSDWEGGAISSNRVTAAQTLGAFGQAAAVTNPDTAGAAQTVGAFTQAATVQAGDTVSASAAQTLPSFTQAAAAGTRTSAVAAQQLGAFLSTAVARVNVAAQAVQQLLDFAQTATAATVSSASAAQTVAPFTQSTAAAAVQALRAAQQIDPFGQAADAHHFRVISAPQQLGAFAQVARLAHAATFERNERSFVVAGERRGYAVNGEFRVVSAVPEIRVAPIAGERRRIAFTD